MIVDISLGCVVSQTPRWGTLVRFPRPLSLMFPYSRRVMIVLRWSLYGVVSDGSVLGLFVPLPPAVLTGFPQEANISLEAAVGRIVFQSCVHRVSLTVQKHLDSCATFHKAVVTSRAFPSHFVFVLRAGSSPGPYTQCGIVVPSEKAAVRESCFPGRSALLPMRRALSPRKS